MDIPENKQTPNQKAQQIKKKFEKFKIGTDLSKQDLKEIHIKYQKGIISALKKYGITSEYENEVLEILRK